MTRTTRQRKQAEGDLRLITMAPGDVRADIAIDRAHIEKKPEEGQSAIPMSLHSEPFTKVRHKQLIHSYMSLESCVFIFIGSGTATISLVRLIKMITR